jgi:hypothetical protein
MLLRSRLKIWFFGFNRGAYAVRVLAAFLHALKIEGPTASTPTRLISFLCRPPSLCPAHALVYEEILALFAGLFDRGNEPTWCCPTTSP